MPIYFKFVKKILMKNFLLLLLCCTFFCKKGNTQFTKDSLIAQISEKICTEFEKVDTVGLTKTKFYEVTSPAIYEKVDTAIRKY
jgi:hypothetical protein